MAVVTTGFFDGVHLGHRHVLETVVSSARERAEEAVVVTFWPHPRTVLQQDARDLRLLTTLEEKKALLKAAGIDRVEVIPFTRGFAAMKAREYLEMLKSRYGDSLVVMGYDNHIGADLLCASALEGLSGVNMPQIAPVSVFSSHSGAKTPLPAPISSTQIRKTLQEGKVELAADMLGYRYGLQGVVVAGNRLGRTIGFPTANMQLYEPLKLVPANGVYAVEVEVDSRSFRGMCNIGVRPTVGGSAQTIETHILDFDEDIYGLPISLHFLRRIRDERKFPSLDALKEQLGRDALICKK
ncbi:MAG: riboflavin biosynthesis protein RibF, partial [Bacteroidales bacterium]|nr:riboflavin biosynthesis protein RibF [Bacteroidales bacterium]